MPRGFDPNQPRWPRGMPGVGGQWKPAGLPSALAGAIIDALAPNASDRDPTPRASDFSRKILEFTNRLGDRRWGQMSVAQALRAAREDAEGTWQRAASTEETSPAHTLISRLRTAERRYGSVAPRTVEQHDARQNLILPVLRPRIPDAERGTLTEVPDTPVPNTDPGPTGQSPLMSVPQGPHAVENAPTSSGPAPADLEVRRGEIRSLGRHPRIDLVNSPARSAAGRLRNLGAMREQKLRELADQMTQGDSFDPNSTWYDMDPLAAEGIYLEFRARGLDVPSYVPTAGAVSPEERASRLPSRGFFINGDIVRIDAPDGALDGEVGDVTGEDDVESGNIMVNIEGTNYSLPPDQLVLSDAATEQAHRDEVDALDVAPVYSTQGPGGTAEQLAATDLQSDVGSGDVGDDNVTRDDEAMAWWQDLGEARQRSAFDLSMGGGTYDEFPADTDPGDWWDQLEPEDRVTIMENFQDRNTPPLTPRARGASIERPEDRPVDRDLRGSPARSTTGRIRNIRSMSEATLLTLVDDLVRRSGSEQPWAVRDPEGSRRVLEALEGRGFDLTTANLRRHMMASDLPESLTQDAMSQLESDLGSVAEGPSIAARLSPLERNYVERLNGMAGSRQVRLDTPNGTFEGDVVRTETTSGGADYVELRNQTGGGTTRIPIQSISGLQDLGSIAQPSEVVVEGGDPNDTPTDRVNNVRSPFRHADNTLRDIDNMTLDELRELDEAAHHQDRAGTPWNVSDPEGSAILARALEATGISRRFGDTPVSELREARLRAIAAEPSDPRFADAVRRLRELRPSSRRWRRLAEEHGIEAEERSPDMLRAARLGVAWDTGTDLAIHERVLATSNVDLGSGPYSRVLEARRRAGLLTDRILAGLIDQPPAAFSSTDVRRAILYEAAQRGLNPGQQTGAEWLRGRGNREAAAGAVDVARDRLPLTSSQPSLNDLRSHEGLANYLQTTLNAAVEAGRLPTSTHPEVHARGQYARISVGNSTVAYVQTRGTGTARGRVSIVGLQPETTPEGLTLTEDTRHMGDAETGLFPASYGPLVAAAVERAAAALLAQPQRPRRAHVGRAPTRTGRDNRQQRLRRGIAATSAHQLPEPRDGADQRLWSLEVEYEGPQMSGTGGYGGRDWEDSVRANYAALQRRGFETEAESQSYLYAHSYFTGFYDSRGDGTTSGHPEMKFPVMSGPEGDEVAREGFAAMREAGGHSAGRRGSGTSASGFGTHVSIDARDMSMEQRKKAGKSWKNNRDLIDQLTPPERYGARAFTFGGRAGTATPYYAQVGTEQSHGSREVNWGSGSKIEFRRLPGTLDDDLVVPYAALVRGLVQHSKRFGAIRSRSTLKELLELLERNGNLSTENKEALLAKAREITRGSPDARVDSAPAEAARSMTQQAIDEPSSTRTVGGVSRLHDRRRIQGGRPLTPVAQMQEAAIRRVARDPGDPRYRDAIREMRRLRPRSREWRDAARLNDIAVPTSTLLGR